MNKRIAKKIADKLFRRGFPKAQCYKAKTLRAAIYHPTRKP
jgi:hypothetical protein